jgi:hypothetical protein
LIGAVLCFLLLTKVSFIQKHNLYYEYIVVFLTERHFS